jgi:Fe-S-cluster containining protein
MNASPTNVVSKLHELEERSKELQADFTQLYTDACLEMVQALDDGKGLQELFRLSDAFADSLLTSVFNSSQPACKASCFECCLLPVQTPELTVQYVADHLQATRSDRELTVLTQQLRHYVSKLNKAPEGQRQDQRIPCPFLAADRTCSIYQVRPLPCRAFNSPDRALCQMNARVDHGRKHTVPQSPLIFRTYEAAATAIKAYEGGEEAPPQVFFIPRLLELLELTSDDGPNGT